MFTTPVFIRKNTPELRHKLKELGYEICPCTYSWGNNNWLFNVDIEIHCIVPEEQEIFIE